MYAGYLSILGTINFRCVFRYYYGVNANTVVDTQKNRLDYVDGSFEHPKYMFKLMAKKYSHFYAQKVLFSGPVMGKVYSSRLNEH